MYRTLFNVNLPGLPGKVNLSGIIGWITLSVALFLIMTLVKDIAGGSAIIGALGGVALHMLVCLVHQAGHAYAAKQTGYPMIGWRTFWLLETSLYPKDEPELPAETHVRRALGGQYFSLPLFILAIVVAGIVLPDQGVVGFLAVFFVIDTLIFSLGALIPTPFFETDGGTLLRWWPKRGQDQRLMQ